MALTSFLGKSLSRLGNIKLGGNSQLGIDTETFTSELGTEASYPGNLVLGFLHLGVVVTDISESLVIVETLIGDHVNDQDTVTNEVVTLTEFIIRGARLDRNISEVLTINEVSEIRVPVVSDVTTSDLLVLSESLPKTVTLQKSVSDVLVMVEAIVRGASYAGPKSETLTIIETLSHEHYKLRNLAESLTINETLTALKVIPNTISESLGIVEAIITGSTFNRTISESLNLHGGMIKILRNDLGVEYAIGEVEYVKVTGRCYIILECATSPTHTAIILPCPQMGDSERSLHSQVVKRSMTNVLYTYVRRNDLQQLSYTFILGRPLAYDLQDFVEANISRIITLTNWKGEVWKVRITTNPLDFVSQSRYENEGEKWQVTIEFQGLRMI